MKNLSLQNYLKIALTLFVVFIITIGFLGSFYVNSPTQISVVTTLGKISSIEKGGLFFKLPFVSRLNRYDTTIQSIECIDNRGNDNCPTLDGGTKDLQSVKVAVQVSYQIDPTKISELFNLVQDQATFNNTIVPATVEEAVKVTTAKYTSEELITQRQNVKETLEKELQNRLDKFYLKVVALNITNFDFNQIFQQAIENKSILTQQVLQKEQEIKKVEAENRIKISQAETDARVKKTQAEGDAQAINANGEAIRKNPEVLELEKIKKWDGKLPQVQGSTNTIIDLEKK